MSEAGGEDTAREGRGGSRKAGHDSEARLRYSRNQPAQTLHLSIESTDLNPVIVLGTGLAGYSVAREFRRLDKATPLLVISRDHAGFYSKPMLSNALAGNKTASR